MNDTVCGNSGIGKKKFQHESHFADLAFERLFESTVGKVSGDCTPQTRAANSIPRETLQDDQHKSLNDSVNGLMENCVGNVVDVAPVYCDLSVSSRRNRHADVINCVLPISNVLQNNGEDYSPSIQQKVSTDTDVRYIPQDSSSHYLIYSKDFVSLSTSVNRSSSEKEISSSNYTIEEGHNLSINKQRNSLVTNQMLIMSDLRPSVRRSHSVGELGVQEHNVDNNIARSNTPVCQMSRSKIMPIKSDLQPSVRRSYSVGQEHNVVNNIEHSITLPVCNLTMNRNTHSEPDLQPSVRRSHSVEELSRQGHINVVSNIASSNTLCNMAENTSMLTDSDLQPSDRSRRTSVPSDQQNQCFRKRIAQKVHRESLKGVCSLKGQKADEGHETLGHSSTLEIFDCNQFKETSITVQPNANVNKQSEKTNALHVQSIKTSAVNSLELDVVKDTESKSVDCDSGISFDLNLANSENSNLSCKQLQHNKGVSALQASRTMPAVHRRISLPLDEIKTCHENDGDNYLTCLSGQQANNADKLKDINPETYHKTKSYGKVGRKRCRLNSGTETSASVMGVAPGNCKRLKKRSSNSDIFVKGYSLTPKSHSSKRLLSNSSDSSLKSFTDESKQKCSKNRLREDIQAISESNDIVRGVTKNKRSKKPLCSYKNEQNEINRIHETIAASADQIALCSTTARNDSNETDTVGGLNLEKVIPLGALTPAMQNIRKAKLKTKSRKGALHRIPSKETIWININSKY